MAKYDGDRLDQTISHDKYRLILFQPLDFLCDFLNNILDLIFIIEQEWNGQIMYYFNNVLYSPFLVTIFISFPYFQNLVKPFKFLKVTFISIIMHFIFI